MDVKITWRNDKGNMTLEAVGPSGVKMMMDSNPQHGGKGLGPSPMETMLFAVGGCTGMDVLSILRKKRQQVESMEIHLNGTRADEFPKEYTKVELKYVIKGKDLKPQAVERAIELSQEQYCGASRSLESNVEVTYSYEIRE